MTPASIFVLIICVVLSALLAVGSCIALNNSSKKSGKSPNQAEKNNSAGESGDLGKEKFFIKISKDLKAMTVGQWAAGAVYTVLTGFACFRAHGFGADIIQTIRAIVCCELVMSAAITDMFTRKIPNKLNLILYAAGVLLLAAEFFYNRENFPLRLEASLIGVGIGFGFLFVMSLAAKGGLGMGDVKLIGGVGFAFGIASIVYSIMYGMLICLLAAIVMLVTGRKKIEDKIPFCPFFFLGLVVSLSTGTF